MEHWEFESYVLCAKEQFCRLTKDYVPFILFSSNSEYQQNRTRDDNGLQNGFNGSLFYNNFCFFGRQYAGAYYSVRESSHALRYQRIPVVTLRQRFTSGFDRHTHQYG